ncbi:agamous-like MADS-box protein AGL62 [Tanacetum coccineum]
MVIVNNMNNKTNQGRKKIEIKKIEENNSRQVTFSKRRNGLFKKAAELCVLTGAKIAIIVNSPGGRVFAFGHPNVDALINTYLANGKDVDVDVDVGQSALPTNDFNQHYAEVQRELELEKKRKDRIPEKKTGSEFWFDEPIDGMDVAELEQYFSSLQELKRKVLTRADELKMMNNAPALFGSNLNNNTPIQGPNVLQHLQGRGPNVLQGLQGPNVLQGLQGPNVLSPQGPNVFDNAWKYYNGQYFFDHALTMNASLQGQGTECAAASAGTGAECAAGSAGTECVAGSAGTECFILFLDDGKTSKLRLESLPSSLLEKVHLPLDNNICLSLVSMLEGTLKSSLDWGNGTLDAKKNNGAPLPKFGDLDVNDPTSGEDFTIIFDKARDEKKTSGKPDSRTTANLSFKNATSLGKCSHLLTIS